MNKPQRKALSFFSIGLGVFLLGQAIYFIDWGILRRYPGLEIEDFLKDPRLYIGIVLIGLGIFIWKGLKNA